jgi:hypothetical protein
MELCNLKQTQVLLLLFCGPLTLKFAICGPQTHLSLRSVNEENYSWKNSSCKNLKVNFRRNLWYYFNASKFGVNMLRNWGQLQLRKRILNVFIILIKSERQFNWRNDRKKSFIIWTRHKRNFSYQNNFWQRVLQPLQN